MFIIAGLGNPDKKYEGTRHNAGFAVMDALAEQYNIDMNIRKYRAFCGKGMIDGQKVFLMKPQTYMNLSGESIIQAVNFFQADPETELLVIYDDISLDVGQLRIRKKGSAGGHNGIKNIIAHLGTQVFPRIRVGVGDIPEHGDLVNHVLGRLKGNDKERVEEAAGLAVKAAAMIVNGEIDAAMNEYNRKKKE